MFEAKRDIRVYAIGIFGPIDDKPRDFTVGYKYNVQDGPEVNKNNEKDFIGKNALYTYLSSK